MKTRELVFTSIFTALTAICAQIFIPTPFSPVPVTLQVLAVFLAGSILGSKLGLISQLVYLFLGAIGIPVFSGLRGGLHVILGPYGGYLIGFPIAAFIIGKFLDTYRDDSPLKSIILNVFGMIIGLIVIYFFGSIQYSILSNITLLNSLAVMVIPFIIPDLLKLIIASFVAYYVRKALIRANIINLSQPL